MKPCITNILLAALLLGTTAGASAGTIKCWKNAQGVRECGQFVPPEFSQERVEVLNERGVVVEVKKRAKTKEERAERDRLLALKKEEERRQAIQQKYDRVLMMTFSSEHDLQLTYQDNVDAIKGIIEVSEANNRNLQKKLTEVQSRAANHERAGQATPKYLLGEMDKLKQQIADNQKYIDKKKLEVTAMDKKYQSDLKRFRILKGTKAPRVKPTVKK